MKNETTSERAERIGDEIASGNIPDDLALADIENQGRSAAESLAAAFHQMDLDDIGADCLEWRIAERLDILDAFRAAVADRIADRDLNA